MKNIRVSWVFVLCCLLLSYFGQSAWALQHVGERLGNSGVFYSLVPKQLLPYVIAIAAAAAIIASQALISGCFTLVNEAFKLRLWVNMRVQYPSHSKGQIYIAPVNWFLMFGCLAVLFIFQESAKMEAAYGLSITINMLMTTMLLLLFFHLRGVRTEFLILLGILFFALEFSFLFSNAKKFLFGGWFTFIIASGIFITMFLFHKARRFRNRHFKKEDLHNYSEMFIEIMEDDSIQRDTTNLVFMSKSGEEKGFVDSNLIYSIFHNKPKKADVYWFVNVEILDNPYGEENLYSVKTILPGKVFYVHLQVGFKVKYTVRTLFKKVVEEMVLNGEVDEKSRYASLRRHDFEADFKFVFVKSMVSSQNELSRMNKIAMATYSKLYNLGYPVYKEFGLDTSTILEEIVPLNYTLKGDLNLKRLD